MTNFSFGPTGFSGSGDFTAPNNAGTHTDFRLMRYRLFNKNGSGTTNSSYTFHVIDDFGLSTQGGMVIYHCHNWINDRSMGIISWTNNGTGAPLHVVALDKIYENGHTASIATGANDHEITLSFTNTHTNGHGHQLFMWGGR